MQNALAAQTLNSVVHCTRKVLFCFFFPLGRLLSGISGQRVLGEQKRSITTEPMCNTQPRHRVFLRLIQSLCCFSNQFFASIYLISDATRSTCDLKSELLMLSLCFPFARFSFPFLGSWGYFIQTFLSLWLCSFELPVFQPVKHIGVFTGRSRRTSVGLMSAEFPF